MELIFLEDLSYMVTVLSIYHFNKNQIRKLKFSDLKRDPFIQNSLVS